MCRTVCWTGGSLVALCSDGTLANGTLKEWPQASGISAAIFGWRLLKALRDETIRLGSWVQPSKASPRNPRLFCVREKIGFSRFPELERQNGWAMA
jgi:hypothetical protein